MPNVFVLLMMGVVGWLGGILINVLSDDLPQRRRPAAPKYPDGSARPVLAWSALLAIAFGKQRGPDGASLPIRHLLVELVCIVSFPLIWREIGTFGLPAPLWQQIVFMIYLWIMILITVIDIEHRLILFVVILPACAFGLLAAGAATLFGGIDPKISSALIGGLIGFGIFFVFYIGGHAFNHVMSRIRGYEIEEVAFGYGDVLLALFSGIILGQVKIFFALMFAVFLGAFGALIYLAIRFMGGKKYQAFMALPYGPYIVLGALAWLFFAEHLGAWVTGVP
jgi:prepilin signal peptidase PulO-like enzyme (type II secretory pathway)